jgi:hypothetical protein
MEPAVRRVLFFVRFVEVKQFVRTQTVVEKVYYCRNKKPAGLGGGKGGVKTEVRYTEKKYRYLCRKCERGGFAH